MKLLPPSTSQSGFSLLELAVILSIFGLMSSMVFTLGTAWSRKAEVDNAKLTMQLIEDALYAYAKTNGRLPCPGQYNLLPGNANYGLEAEENGITTPANDADPCRTGGSITATNATTDVVFGSVPAKTLGLSENVMRDPWGRLIKYMVTETTTREGALLIKEPEAYNANYLQRDDATAGNITVNDANNSTKTADAVYALISFGANGHGGRDEKGNIVNSGSTDASELNNCDCSTVDNIIVSRLMDDTYDDLVIYKMRFQLPWDPSDRD